MIYKHHIVKHKCKRSWGGNVVSVTSLVQAVIMSGTENEIAYYQIINLHVKNLTDMEHHLRNAQIIHEALFINQFLQAPNFIYDENDEPTIIPKELITNLRKEIK